MRGRRHSRQTRVTVNGLGVDASGSDATALTDLLRDPDEWRCGDERWPFEQISGAGYWKSNPPPTIAPQLAQLPSKLRRSRKNQKTQEKCINAYCLRLCASVNYFTHTRSAALGSNGLESRSGRCRTYAANGQGLCVQPSAVALEGRGERWPGGDFTEDGRGYGLPL
jgi:hypothetical protein